MLDKVLANIVSMYSISRLSHDYLHVLGGSEIVVEFYNYRRFILLQKSVEYKEIKKKSIKSSSLSQKDVHCETWASP